METQGRAGEVEIKLPGPIASAWEVDLLEDEINQINVKGSSISFKLKANEIKSFKLQFSARVAKD